MYIYILFSNCWQQSRIFEIFVKISVILQVLTVYFRPSNFYFPYLVWIFAIGILDIFLIILLHRGRVLHCKMYAKNVFQSKMNRGSTPSWRWKLNKNVQRVLSIWLNLLLKIYYIPDFENIWSRDSKVIAKRYFFVHFWKKDIPIQYWERLAV